jgi:transposase
VRARTDLARVRRSEDKAVDKLVLFLCGDAREVGVEGLAVGLIKGNTRKKNDTHQQGSTGALFLKTPTRQMEPSNVTAVPERL